MDNYDKIKADLEKRIKNEGRIKSIGAYLLINKKGVIWDYGWPSYCYAKIGGHHDTEGFDYFAASHLPARINRKDAIAIADWLANRSQWSDLILTKDPEYILDIGSIWKTCASTRYIFNGANILRDLGENPYLLKGWNKLVKAGIEGHVALILSMHMKEDTDNPNLYDMTQTFGGHTWINSGGFDQTAFQNFLDRKIVKVHPDMEKGSLNYDGRSFIWGGTYNSGKLMFSGEKSQAFDAWGGRISNKVVFNIKNIPSDVERWMKENKIVCPAA